MPLSANIRIPVGTHPHLSQLLHHERLFFLKVFQNDLELEFVTLLFLYGVNVMLLKPKPFGICILSTCDHSFFVTDLINTGHREIFPSICPPGVPVSHVYSRMSDTFAAGA